MGHLFGAKAPKKARKGPKNQEMQPEKQEEFAFVSGESFQRALHARLAQERAMFGQQARQLAGKPQWL